MFSKKQITTDLLFWVQLVCTLVFGLSQFFKTLTTTQGINVSMFWSWQFFLSLNLALVIKAHRNQPSRATLLVIISYLTWVVMVSLDLIAMYAKDVGIWNSRDSYAAVIVAIGVLGTFVVGHYRHLTINKDPEIKAALAIFFKVVPQLVWAYNITLVGGGGLAWPAIIAGHVTINSRIGQLWLTVREAGWDKNRICAIVSESANELSWLVVTISWLISTF